MLVPAGGTEAGSILQIESGGLILAKETTGSIGGRLNQQRSLSKWQLQANGH